MKKKKISLSKEGIQWFFFRHVEKLLFGIACILILVFVWLGLKSPAFDATTPSALLDQTKNAEVFINKSKHWDDIQQFRSADTEASKRILDAKQVDPANYPYRQISGTAVYTLEPRRDPAFLPPQNFEIQLVRSQVAFNDSVSGDSSGGIADLPESVLVMPSEQISESFISRPAQFNSNKKARLGTRDVVVGMALIDHRQQLVNYNENFQFQRGYDPVRDKPDYSAIEVQRKTANSDWESITRRIYVVDQYLQPAAKELADEKYISETITLPIPPLVGIDYRQFALLDEIPTVQLLDEDKKENKSEGSDSKNDNDFDNLYGGNGSGSKSAGSDSKNEGSDSKSEGSGNKNEGSGSKSPGALAVDSENDEAPFRLIRFYDLDNKVPGETYSYRLRVWIKDPNNPAAVNADIKAAKNSKDGRKNIGLGEGAGLSDGPGAGGKSAGEEKPKTPLKETDLSGDVRQRVRQKKTIPAEFESRWSTKPGDPQEQKREALSQAFKYSIPTEWVECSQPITISAGFETFVAGPVKSPSIVKINGGEFSTSEPTVQIVANSFQEDLKAFVPAQTETLRGSLLNFTNVAYVLDPLSWAIREVATENPRGEKIGRRYQTDAVVLDILGGNTVGRGDSAFQAPGECLIMDRNGRIFVKNEVDDATAWRHANFTSEDNAESLAEANDRKRNDDDDDDDEDTLGGAG